MRIAFVVESFTRTGGGEFTIREKSGNGSLRVAAPADTFFVGQEADLTVEASGSDAPEAKAKKPKKD